MWVLVLAGLSFDVVDGVLASFHWVDCSKSNPQIILGLLTWLTLISEHFSWEQTSDKMQMGITREAGVDMGMLRSMKSTPLSPKCR